MTEITWSRVNAAEHGQGSQVRGGTQVVMEERRERRLEKADMENQYMELYTQ